MLEHHKQLTRRFNSLKTKKRYREKRERRVYLAEAYNDGELALYKPTHVPYRIFTDKVQKKMVMRNGMAISETAAADLDKLLAEATPAPIYQKPVKFSWFEKFLLWVRKCLT